MRRTLVVAAMAAFGFTASAVAAEMPAADREFMAHFAPVATVAEPTDANGKPIFRAPENIETSAADLALTELWVNLTRAATRW